MICVVPLFFKYESILLPFWMLLLQTYVEGNQKKIYNTW